MNYKIVEALRLPLAEMSEHDRKNAWKTVVLSFSAMLALAALGAAGCYFIFF